MIDPPKDATNTAAETTLADCSHASMPFGSVSASVTAIACSNRMKRGATSSRKVVVFRMRVL